jgi:hypothetical protein
MDTHTIMKMAIVTSAPVAQLQRTFPTDATDKLARKLLTIILRTRPETEDGSEVRCPYVPINKPNKMKTSTKRKN